MPGRAAWEKLFRDTVGQVDRADVTDLYQVDWREASAELVAEHRDAIEAEKSAWIRFFRTANAILYGLLSRLSPSRRLLLASALFLTVVGVIPVWGGRNPGDEPGSSGLLLLGAVLTLLTLLGMELVEKLQFRNELFSARDLQAELIPKAPPAVPGFELGAFNRIANTVGGDLYDFERLPDGRLSVLFGDASGHGMTAGLVMAVTHAAYRTQLAVDPSPEAVLATLNRVLCRTGECRRGGPRQFFAGVALLFNPDGTFRVAVAGHPPVLKLDTAGRLSERFGKGSYPVGIKSTSTWSVESGSLAPGETLLLHSDGLTEARDATGAPFGDLRVELLAARHAGASAPDLVAALSSALHDFLGRRAVDDDVSIAAVRRVEAG